MPRYAAWMRADDKIAGIFPWHWGDEPVGTEGSMRFGAAHPGLLKTMAALQFLAKETTAAPSRKHVRWEKEAMSRLGTDHRMAAQRVQLKMDDGRTVGHDAGSKRSQDYDDDPVASIEPITGLPFLPANPFMAN